MLNMSFAFWNGESAAIEVTGETRFVPVLCESLSSFSHYFSSCLTLPYILLRFLMPMEFFSSLSIGKKSFSPPFFLPARNDRRGNFSKVSEILYRNLGWSLPFSRFPFLFSKLFQFAILNRLFRSIPLVSFPFMGPLSELSLSR